MSWTKKLALGVLAGAVLLAALFYAGGSPYSWFKNETFSLKVKFQYPKLWRLRMENGQIERYSQVMVLGPRNADNTYTAAFFVRETKTDSATSESLKALKKKRLDHLYKDPKILSEAPVSVGSVSAEEVTTLHSSPPRFIKGAANLPVDVRSRMVFLQKGASVFEIVYMADQREFQKNEKDFDRLLKSFRFL